MINHYSLYFGEYLKNEKVTSCPSYLIRLLLILNMVINLSQSDYINNRTRDYFGVVIFYTWSPKRGLCYLKGGLNS